MGKKRRVTVKKRKRQLDIYEKTLKRIKEDIKKGNKYQGTDYDFDTDLGLLKEAIDSEFNSGIYEKKNDAAKYVRDKVVRDTFNDYEDGDIVVLSDKQATKWQEAIKRLYGVEVSFEALKYGNAAQEYINKINQDRGNVSFSVFAFES